MSDEISTPAIPIRQKFFGKRWEEIRDALPESDEEKKDKGEKQDVYVHRLRVHDMGLYGLFPETDRFCAVVCDCGAVVKPQGLKNHLARNHSGSSYYLGAGSCSRSNHSSSNSPASSTSSTPVKNQEDFSGILPKAKHKYGKVKSAKVARSPKFHSSNSQPPLVTEVKGVTLTVPEFIINASSNSLDSGSSIYTFSGNKSVLVSGSKSGRRSKHRHKLREYAGYDPNKHCGVYLPEEGKPCLNALSCKVHGLLQKRQVKGRCGSFDSLLADQSHLHSESTSSSCSSVLEKHPPDASEELNNLIKNHIEMPTIVLRKIDEDIKELGHLNVNMDHVKLENADEPLIIEGLEAEQMLTDIQVQQLLQQETQDAVSAIQQQTHDDIFIDHEESPIMLHTTQQPILSSTADATHITCRTVAFPLYLLAKESGVKMEGELSFEDDKGNVLMQNLLQLQTFVPLFRDTYCDIFSKFEQNILNDASNLFPTLTTVESHENHAVDKRFEDHRSIKSCMYSALPKPSHVNTFGMRRIGGGATISRRSYYLRKTLLKNRGNDQKLKLKTDSSGFSTCQQSPHGVLTLTSSNAVNKAKRRSFLANTSASKIQRLASPNEASSSVSELNQSPTPSDLKFASTFTNSFNHHSKMEVDSSVPEDMMQQQAQPRKQIFVPRFP